MDLIVCYDPLEIEALEMRLTGATPADVPGSRFPATVGRLHGRPVAVLRLPFGNDPALFERVLGAAIDRFAPTTILSLGTAMARDPRIPVGHLFLTAAALHEGRAATFTPALIDLARRAAPHGMALATGTSLTVSTFVEGSLAGDGFDLVEMEDHWLALHAGSRKLPVLSIRAVTDHGSFAAHMANRSRAILPALRLLERFFWRRRMEELVVERKNPSTQDLPFRMVVLAAAPLTLPEAVRTARSVSRDFSLTTSLTAGARVDVEILPPSRWTSAPAGWETVATAIAGARFLRSPAGDEALVQLPRAHRGTMRRASDHGVWPKPDRVHLQGISTISAEPEEGLLAAITLDELEEARMAVVDSVETDLWVYRTGDTREKSYFDLPEGYVYPHRTSPEAPRGTRRVVTGLGPAIDPESTGGLEADTLMLGDEMGGRLLLYLDELGGISPTAEAVFRHPGIVQRLDESTVALSRIDLRPALRDQALDRLVFRPASLRRIYPRMVNERLSEYFMSDSGAPERSYLLMSSRGCGLKCSICCSGGFQKFQALSAASFVGLLGEIARAHEGEPGKIEIHLLDSYFNLQPGRVERIAQLMEEKGLGGRFQLHLRHSGLRTFLRGGSSGAADDAAPNVHRDLIRAYRRLGLSEVVMGIDAYTDRAIQVLKTDVEKLARGGAATPPAYRFRDIRAVLAALEEEGLDSRGFLLLNNPFLDDAGRIETFYNLVDLALEVPGFMIDASSSSAVNELKPFPGAPLTEVARRIPGLVQGDRFVFRTELGRLDERIDFSAFGQRRRKPEDLARFARRVQASRTTLARLMLHHFRDNRVARRATTESFEAALRWIESEVALAGTHRAFFLEHADPRAEWALSTARSLLQRRLRARMDSPLRHGVDRYQLLFEHLTATNANDETIEKSAPAGGLQVLRP